MNSKSKGKLVLYTGSSGVGKGTIMAERMKKFSQEGKLSEDVMLAIMSEEKKGDLDKVTLSSDTLRKYFPKSYTPAKMQETIIKLLEQWQKKRQRDQER